MNKDFLRERNEFLDFFPNCTGSSLYITPKLLKSESDNTIIHSAIWKFYLLIAPSIQKQYAKDEDWIRILKEKRSEFFALREKHFIKAPDADDDDKNSAGTDPLLNAQSAEWSQFYNDQDLRKQIRTDTARAFQELEFFQKQENQDILEDMLFLFVRTHPSYGYPQGLHELAAFILYTFHEEMISANDDTISFIFSSSSVVSDAYCVFAQLAEMLGPFYNATPEPNSNSNTKPNDKINLTIANCQDISEICGLIQSNIIGRESEELVKALSSSGIQPHTYMMKWMRLLFLSVFDLNSCKTMWDIIIAYLPNLDIITYTCASLLLNSTNNLTKCDSTELLQILFHYPKVPNPYNFVIKAVDMYNEYTGKNDKKKHIDIVTIVAERLNELSRGLNEICTVKGYEDAMPYVMDLRRTRDILLGILPSDEMLPLEMALEIFKPQKVEYKPVEIIVDSFDKDNRINKNYKNDDLFTPVMPNANSNSTEQNNSVLPQISSGSTKVKTDLLFAEDNSSSKSKGKQKSSSIIRKTSDLSAGLFGDDQPKVEGETLLKISSSSNNSSTEDAKPLKKVSSIKIKNIANKTSSNKNNTDYENDVDPLLGENHSKPLPNASSPNSHTKGNSEDILFGGKEKPKSTPSSLFDEDTGSTQKKKPKKKKSLFDDLNGDDLFS